MASRIVIHLNKRRDLLGTISLVDELGAVLSGPFDCLAIADNAAAIQHNNRTKDPLKSYGNTPTGIWKAVIYPPGSDTHAYGDGERFYLVPVSGQCVDAEKDAPGKPPRSDIAIHGGDENLAYTYWHGLRPTYGCVRTHNDDLAHVIKMVRVSMGENTLWVPCEIAEVASQATAA